MRSKIKYAGGTMRRATKKDWDKLEDKIPVNKKTSNLLPLTSTNRIDMYKSLVGGGANVRHQ